MPEVCPQCGERAVVPLLANKYRCRACGTYLDLVDLLKHKRGS